MNENVDINEMRENIAQHVDWALDRKIPLPELQATFRSVKHTLSARNGEGLKTKLNSEFDLQNKYQASRDTIRKALLLSQNGYIQKSQGKGSIVLDINRFNFPVNLS